jgi:hypothetical protein
MPSIRISVRSWYSARSMVSMSTVDVRAWMDRKTVAGSVPRGKTEPVILQKIQSGLRIASKRDIVHVDQMELVSANLELAEELDWPDSIDVDLAKRELTKAFYAFASINWVPWESALKVAGEQHKPILAIVLWGALDDQSC